MLLYTQTITPRLQYTADFISRVIGAGEIVCTNNQDIYLSSGKPRINYSNQPVSANEVWIKPHTLLFENEIKEQAISCFSCNGFKAFFKTEGHISFDIFAAIFYLLSRYEEYLPHQKDMYGRYAHQNSLAYREGFLQQPLINYWLEHFKFKLLEKFPGAGFPVQSFMFLPTYDIDEAYSYKEKQWWRTAGGFVKSVIKGQWIGITERLQVLRGSKPDPYDAFGWMNELHDRYGLKPFYFFLVAEKNGRYDKNILPVKKALQQLIRQHFNRYAAGIHPSWQSGDDPRIISKEKLLLEKIAGKKIIRSRQHYIRFSLPETFRQLIAAGIQYDFSMGYGSCNGFRASVASPFYWYDLPREETTSLLLYPFCFMDANSFYEQRQSPGETLKEMLQYYSIVKSVNGAMITIWHNSFLGTEPRFEGWREIYESFVKAISTQEG